MDATTSPAVTNIVVKYFLSFDINLDFLKFALPSVDYRPKRFNGAIVKDFGCCLLVFRNGKVNVVENKTLEQADKAIVKFCEAIGSACKYSKEK